MNDEHAISQNNMQLMNWVWLIVCAVVVRGAVQWQLYPNLNEDRDEYRSIAQNLAKHGVLARTTPTGSPGAPTAYRPPLYPMILSTIAAGGEVTPGAVAGLHLLLGILTVVMVCVIGQWWNLGLWSLLAALLVACDPILLFWSTYVMTETLATLLAVVGLFVLTCFTRKPVLWIAGIAGGTLAVAVLCRPVFLVWLVAVLICVLFQRDSWHRRASKLLVVIVVVCLVLAPWTMRNRERLGRPVVATTHGGYTLLLGNNPHFYEFLKGNDGSPVFDSARFDTEWQEAVVGLNEVEADRKAYQVAFAQICNQPAMFLYASVVRVGWLWSPLPRQLAEDEQNGRRVVRFIVAVWYCATYLLAIVGIIALRQRVLQTPWLWGVTVCLSFMLVHACYWTNMRMRAPLVPFIALLAAAGAMQIASWQWRRK